MGTNLFLSALVWGFMGLSVGIGGFLWTAVPFMGAIFMLIMPVNGIILMYFREEKQPVQTLGKVAMGWIYVFFPFLLFYFLSFASCQIGFDGKLADCYEPRLALGVLMIVWMCDIAAYFGGKAMGKHKLFERISPKKTWEGTVSGAIGGLGMAVLFEFVWPLSWSWIGAGILIVVIAQMGDLVESMLKRSLDIKDSGTILPGHGGILDRFDGLFLALPVLVIYYILFMLFS